MPAARNERTSYEPDAGFVQARGNYGARRIASFPASSPIPLTAALLLRGWRKPIAPWAIRPPANGCTNVPGRRRSNARCCCHWPVWMRTKDGGWSSGSSGSGINWMPLPEATASCGVLRAAERRYKFPYHPKKLLPARATPIAAAARKLPNGNWYVAASFPVARMNTRPITEPSRDPASSVSSAP